MSERLCDNCGYYFRTVFLNRRQDDKYFCDGCKYEVESDANHPLSGPEMRQTNQEIENLRRENSKLKSQIEEKDERLKIATAVADSSNNEISNLKRQLEQ